jgi:hypothetical protein
MREAVVVSVAVLIFLVITVAATLIWQSRLGARSKRAAVARMHTHPGVWAAGTVGAAGVYYTAGNSNWDASGGAWGDGSGGAWGVGDSCGDGGWSGGGDCGDSGGGGGCGGGGCGGGGCGGGS